MKILFVAPRFHTNQFQLVKTLQENDHEVFFHVAAVGDTEDHSLLIPTRYRQSKISLLIEKFKGQGGLNRKYYFPGLLIYWKAFSKLNPDIVIIRNPYRFFSLLVAWYSLFKKTKIIFYTMEELFRYREGKALFKQRMTLSLFKAAWMTPIMGNDTAEKSKLKHMYYVPLPMNVKIIKPITKNIPDEGPKILMIGKYHQDRKNHLLFINAINSLKNRYKFKATIIGECIRPSQIEKYNMLREVIKNLELENIIDLKTSIPFNEMEQLYTSHHAFVLPAINEPYGVSVTEALNYGLPVICTDTCGAKYNIKNGNNGFVIKSNSLSELITAIEFLLKSNKRILQMGDNSVNYVQANLSGNEFYNKFSYLVNDRFQLQWERNTVVQ